MEYTIWEIESTPEITVGLFPPEVHLQVNEYVMGSKINLQ
jgi:hypothetical protein